MFSSAPVYSLEPSVLLQVLQFGTATTPNCCTCSYRRYALTIQAHLNCMQEQVRLPSRQLSNRTVPAQEHFESHDRRHRWQNFERYAKQTLQGVWWSRLRLRLEVKSTRLTVRRTSRQAMVLETMHATAPSGAHRGLITVLCSSAACHATDKPGSLIALIG